MTAAKLGSTYRNRGYTVHTIESLMALANEVGECMEWSGYVGNNTPQVFHAGRYIAVRRLILTLRGINLARGDHAGTKCRNPLCIREDHIQHRTHAQHAAVMGRAPRNDTVRRAKLSTHARAHRAKLTIDQVQEIRASTETGPVLAQRFGVHKSLIGRIRRGEAWVEYRGLFSGLIAANDGRRRA